MGKVVSRLKRRSYRHDDVTSTSLKSPQFTEIPEETVEEHREVMTSLADDIQPRQLTCVCVSATWCAVGSRDGFVAVLDLDSLSERQRWSRHSRDVIKVASRGQMLCSASRDSQIAVWNLEDFSSVGELTDHELAVSGVDFNTSSDWLISGSRDNCVKLWNIERMQCVSSTFESRYRASNVIVMT